jgi:hypothetical protein
MTTCFHCVSLSSSKLQTQKIWTTPHPAPSLITILTTLSRLCVLEMVFQVIISMKYKKSPLFWRYKSKSRIDTNYVTSPLCFQSLQDSQCAYDVTLRHVRAFLQRKSNTYYIFWVCVFVALGIQHAMRMHHIVICGLPHSAIFFRVLS